MSLPVLRPSASEGRTILMRIDINSPLEPNTGMILDDSRFMGHIPTIKDFSSSRLVLLAHQSRPGKEDFTSMESHARKLSSLLGQEVKYVDEAIGSTARREIQALEDDEVLLLENIRFYSEEIHPQVKNKRPLEQASTNLVKRLAPYVDYYVNDAFAVSHRNQPSVVGFPIALPGFAGRLLEKEVRTLEGVVSSGSRPKVFSFGGAKVKDSIRAMKMLLERGIADEILTSGMVGNYFLQAQGKKLGEKNARALEKKDGLKEEAKRLLKKYGDRINLPTDIAVKKDSERMEAKVDSIPDLKIMDIGIETIARYTSIIEKAGVVAANGPCGVFESEHFALGSEELVKAMAKSKAYTYIGGGHLGAITSQLGVRDRVSFISTGGKAFLLLLSGEKLPGVEVLRNREI